MWKRIHKNMSKQRYTKKKELMEEYLKEYKKTDPTMC